MSSTSAASSLVLSPPLGSPPVSAVREAKVFLSTAFNYVVALLFVILPTILFFYTIAGNRWRFVIYAFDYLFIYYYKL
jgi:hypothetical protein